MKQVLQNMKTGDLRVADVPVPALRPGGVVVRVAASCISAGTERNIMDFAKKSYVEKARARPDLVRQVFDKVRKEGLLPTYKAVMSRLDVETALGYSCAGTVVEAGSESGFAVGDRVACAGMGFASHAEYVYVPKNLTVRIPDGVTFEQASYATIGAIAMQGVRTLEITLGEHVVVIGLGIIGLLAMQLVEANGGRAIGIDLDPRKVELAKQLGLQHCMVRTGDCEAAVQGWTQGVGADAVLVAAGAPTPDPLHLAVQLCRKRGRITVLGMVPLELPHKPFYEKELQLKMSTSYGPGRYDPQYEIDGVDYPLPYVRWTERRNLSSFLDLIGAGKVDVGKLTTHHFQLDQAADAYALIEGKVPGAHPVGVLFQMPQGADDKPQRRVELGQRTRKHQGRQVRIGLIGAGTFTRGVLLPAIAAAPDVVFQGVSTATGQTGEKTGSKYGFRYATTDYKALLQDPEVDLVVIATQHRAHGKMVVEALQAGKHVFVEKPLCVTRDELARIREAYQGTGAVVHVGFNRRFSPHVLAVRDHFAGVGEPLFSTYRINAGYAPPGSTMHREGGRVIGEVCHFLDTLIAITGAPIKRMQVAKVEAGNAALTDEDSVALICEHEGGHLSTIQYLARGNALVPKERLEVHGGLRSAVLDDFSTLRRYDGSKVKTDRLLVQDKGHKAQMAQLIAAVRAGSPAPVPFDILCHVTELTIDAAERLAGESGLPADWQRDGDFAVATEV